MNYKTTLFLVVMLLAVGGFFLWAKQKSPPGVASNSSTTATRTEGQPLWSAPPVSMDEVTRLDITAADKQFTFTKDGADWRQTSPVDYPLNSWSVRDMIEAALNLRYVEKFKPDGKDNPARKDIALDPPAASVTLKHQTDPAKTVSLKLGRSTVGGRGYLMLEGDDAVYIVNKRVHELVINADLREWRKKTLSLPALAQAVDLQLKTPQGTLEVNRTEDQWSFKGGHTGRVDADALAGLVGAVNGMYISKFISDNPKDLSAFGLHDAHYELTLHATPTPPTSSPAEAAAKPEESEMKVQPGVKTRYRFKVGGPTDLSMEKFFATLVRESDDAGAQGIVVFEVSSSDVEKLRKTVDDLRDRRLINVKASTVTALKFTPENGEPVLVARSPDGWVYGSPQPAYEVDKMEVLRVLDRWMSARATAFASAGDVAAGQPAYTLELSIENQPQPMVLKVFAAAKDDHWLVVPADESLAYEVPKANLPLADSPLAFRDRVVKNWQSAELTRLLINQPDKPQVMLSRTVSRVDEQAKPGSWTLQGHEKFEPFAVDELIKQLTPIKAQDWLTQAPAWSADSKLIELQITLSDDTQHTLKVSPTDRSAQLGGMDAAFVITPELLTALQAEFAKSSSAITPAPALPLP